MSAVVEAPPAHPPAVAERPPVVIVPLKGLPIVALVLVGIVVAIASNSRWGLVFCHVVGGVLWTAIDLFVGFIVGPIIGRMSIPARIEFTTRFMPKMLLVMPTIVTIDARRRVPARTSGRLPRHVQPAARVGRRILTSRS